MGLTKSAWMDAMERGWSAPDKYVCAACVEDDFLKTVVSDGAEVCECDYCGSTDEEPIAAPMEMIMEVIASAVYFSYAAPQDAGIPFEDGEWVISTMDIAEVFGELEFDGQTEFFDDVISGFDNADWVRATDGYWAATHANQRLGFAWKTFVETVKHETRFHFLTNHEDGEYDPDCLSPGRVLSSIGELLRRFNFIYELPEKTPIFRCRVRTSNEKWEIGNASLGAPPSSVASAGRMNPAGISYFYGAFAVGTAVAEVISRPPTGVAIGRFVTNRTLIVLDLTKVPEPPSAFDAESRSERAAILFLSDFTRQISQPVQKNGSEHIEYVPSQVVCEYLAQMFKVDEDGGRLDGIVYPSTMKPGTNNIVIFPTNRYWGNRFDGLDFDEAAHLTLDDWNRTALALSMVELPNCGRQVRK